MDFKYILLFPAHCCTITAQVRIALRYRNASAFKSD